MRAQTALGGKVDGCENHTDLIRCSRHTGHCAHVDIYIYLTTGPANPGALVKWHQTSPPWEPQIDGLIEVP